jgi:hypothetical protein
MHLIPRTLKAIGFIGFVLVMQLTFVSGASAHSGGTDSSGGHNCKVSSCAGNYHYHGGSGSILAPSIKPSSVNDPTPSIKPSSVNEPRPSIKPSSVNEPARSIESYNWPSLRHSDEDTKERSTKVLPDYLSRTNNTGSNDGGFYLIVALIVGILIFGFRRGFTSTAK